KRVKPLPGPPKVPRSMSLYRKFSFVCCGPACVINGSASAKTITEPRIMPLVVVRLMRPTVLLEMLIIDLFFLCSLFLGFDFCDSLASADGRGRSDWNRGRSAGR